MQIKKVARNAGASFITQIVNIIINFILPPLLIGTYGSSMNGLVISIKQLMSYVKLVGAGISVATTQSLYKPIAEKDYKTISGVVNAANNMFSKAGFFFLTISLITSFLYPLFLSDNLEYHTVALLIIVMSIEGLSEFFIVGKYRTLLYADQKAYITSLVQSAGLILSFIFMYILIKADVNIILVQLASSLVYLFRIVFLTIYINKHYKFLDSKTAPILSAVAKRNDAFIHQITGLAILSSQVIILSTFVGLEVASVYAVYNVVFSGLHSICAQTINAVAPMLGRTIALNKEEKLRSEFNKIEFIFNLVLSFIFSVCTVMIIPFITVYVGSVSDINYVDSGVATLFLIVSFFNTLRLPAQSMINVAGHFKETRWRAVIEATVCIILQIVLVNFIGIYGVLIGTGVALGWRCFDIIIYSNKYIIKQKNRISIIRGIKIPFISLALYGINAVFLNFNVIGYFDWFYWALINSIISLVIIFVVNLIFEKKQLITLIKFIMKNVLKDRKV